MDIESDLNLIYNTLQSGNLDEAFVLHNKMLDKSDLSHENLELKKHISTLEYSRFQLETDI